MRFSALLTATISLAATVVQCRLSDLGIPSTIKPGDIFSAVGHTQISQPRQYTMVWAITAQEDAILGAIGPYLMNVVDLPCKSIREHTLPLYRAIADLSHPTNSGSRGCVQRDHPEPFGSYYFYRHGTRCRPSGYHGILRRLQPAYTRDLGLERHHWGCYERGSGGHDGRG